MYIVADIDKKCKIFFKYFFDNPQLCAKNLIHSRFFDKKPRFSRKIFHNLQNLPKNLVFCAKESLGLHKQLKKKRAGKNKERQRISHTKQKVNRKTPEKKDNKEGKKGQKPRAERGGEPLGQNRKQDATTVKACDGKKIKQGEKERGYQKIEEKRNV